MKEGGVDERMKISEKGLSMIERFEGCLLKASNKLDGVWTIGYGQTGSYYGKRVRRGMTTTKALAHAWLRDHSIKTYEDAVTQAVKVPLNQNQFDALVSFAYNVGVGALKQSTFDATRKLEHPGATCSHYVSWILQDVDLLVAGKRISHDNGKVTGTGNLLGCQVIQAGGKTWDKLDDLRPGDVCVWDSNLAIYAGNGKWYDAGGPFRSNTKDGRYTNIGPIAPYYDRTKPVYYLVRAKV